MRRPSPLIWILRALLAAPLLTDVIGGGSRSVAAAGQPSALRFGMSRELGPRVGGDDDGDYLLIEYETIEREDFERLVRAPTTNRAEPPTTTASLDVG